LKWLPRATWPSGKLNLTIMSAVFVTFGLSLILQPGRWHSTPAYHVLLLIFPAQTWGALFLVSGVATGLAAWFFERHRWAVVASLTAALTLTTGWTLAFAVRWITSTDTTPVTWVAWSVFDYLLIVAALSLDRPAILPPGAELSDFRKAVDDALRTAEDDQETLVMQALVVAGGKRRDALRAAEAAYAEALRAAVPAPSGDLAQQAIEKARTALHLAEEAQARSAGHPAAHQDPP
jgi:hypothetical protein